ncbi:MAG: M24 family metallopeptidase [Bacteroidetes bacterium]|nr:M24 family metallopeptidase [Bacteroidota bacterium]
MEKIKLVHEVRAVKTKKELDSIIKAQRISERVLSDVLNKLKTHAKAGQVGITELEIANFIKKSFIKYKAPILSFPPIVAFGKNTANIHHIPGNSKLKKGDFVMFDFGTTINHYCSDMTRTYIYGTPSPKQKKVYEAVLRSQELALSKLRKGEKKANNIDKVSRNFLHKKFKVLRILLKD